MSALMIMHEVLMLTAEGFIIYAVIKARKKANPGCLKDHIHFALIGLFFVFCAFGFIYSYKQIKSYPHFFSFHAVLGAITILLLLSNASAGLAITRGYLKRKSIHHTLGKITAFFVISTALAGIIRFIEIMTN